MNYSSLNFLFAILCFLPALANAQQLVSASGSHAENDQCMLSWSLGETFINTLVSEDNILTQGFHQGNLLVTLVSENESPSIKTTVYPNPTNDNVFLKIEPETPDNIFYEIHTIQGDILLRARINKQISEIPFAKVKPGTYILNIYAETSLIQSIKVIKSQ